MISLKQTLSAITSKIADINSRLSSLSWYLDYANAVSTGSGSWTYTAPSDGVIYGTYSTSSGLKVARIYVNGKTVAVIQTASGNEYVPFLVLLRKGDKVTTSRESSAVTLSASFIPLKFGGGYNLKALLSLRWSLC